MNSPKSNKGLIEIGREEINKLKQAARHAPLKRARVCLHLKHSDKVQEMVIAFCRGSYIRPHRHTNKSESFHVIEGEIAVVFFDEKGRVRRRMRMGQVGTGYTFLYRLSANLWHTVVPLSEFVIIHETTPGPFIKMEREFAPWAPDEDDAHGIKVFMAGLKVKQ